MFETMQSFLMFFFPVLALILIGIAFEERLIALEDRVFAWVKRVFTGGRREHDAV